MNKDDLILVAGSGGFIGGHLVRRLLREGYRVRAVDIKPFPEWHQFSMMTARGVTNHRVDLSGAYACEAMMEGVSQVYNLAADMGGIGFIEGNKALCMLSVLINTHLLMAARKHRVKRYFFASSACVYNAACQESSDAPPLKESNAYPARPEDGYGWEKLFSERMCRHFTEDFGLETRVARLHNVYGPCGTWNGGREKAPAAICRKVIAAKLFKKHAIGIWGDGEQTRSFMWIDDCIEGIRKIMESDFPEPLNLGSSELVSINELVSIVEEIAEVKLKRNYQLDKPQGVRGRNSDNTWIKDLLNWEPSTPLREGLKETYEWIYDEMTNGEGK